MTTPELVEATIRQKKHQLSELIHRKAVLQDEMRQTQDHMRALHQQINALEREYQRALRQAQQHSYTQSKRARFHQEEQQYTAEHPDQTRLPYDYRH